MAEIFITVFCWLLILIMTIAAICGCIIIVLLTRQLIKELKDINEK